MFMECPIFVFIALPGEAKFLIKNWGLKKYQGRHAFPIYSNDKFILTITGIGKVAMAGAVGYTMAHFSAVRNPVMINIGIAGHGQANIASLYIAEKIVDADTGKTFYPQLIFDLPCLSSELNSVSMPEKNYAKNCLYDMEASGFYEMACKFSSIELIQSVKIISDNAGSTLDNLCLEAVEDWMQKNIAAIEKLIYQLANCRRQLPENNDSQFLKLTAAFHFSASNAVKLKNLLQRWELIHSGEEFDFCQSSTKNAKELLLQLEKRLNNTAFYL
jgi:adenosylhomocysteine nucleosidase